MMRYLTVNEVLEIYSRVVKQSGGSIGIRDLGALESAVAQPRMTFGGEELYPTIVEKDRPWAFRLFRITHLWMVINALVMQQWKRFLF